MTDITHTYVIKTLHEAHDEGNRPVTRYLNQNRKN